MNSKLFKELIKEIENHEKRITIVEKVVDSNSKDIAKLEMENRNLEIKLGLAKGEKASDLARKYGVGKSRISQIKNSWINRTNKRIWNFRKSLCKSCCKNF